MTTYYRQPASLHPEGKRAFHRRISELIRDRLLEEVEVHECYSCGQQGTDRSDFITVNYEPPRMSMDDPYPGYPGDLACRDCVLGEIEVPSIDAFAVDWQLADSSGALDMLADLRTREILVPLEKEAGT